MNVSIDTARRDVKELDAVNKLRKVHGGAISLGYTGLASSNANIYALDQKIAIAQKAISLIHEGSVLFIDGGTTCLELVRLIPPQLKLTCFTLSLPVAWQLLSNPNIKVIFIGGEISRDAQISIGAYAVHQLAEIRFDYSFIGTGYVDAIHGLTEFDWRLFRLRRPL